MKNFKNANKGVREKNMTSAEIWHTFSCIKVYLLGVYHNVK